MNRFSAIWIAHLLLLTAGIIASAMAAANPLATAVPGFVSVSMGTYQTLAVDQEGGLWAWGRNFNGPFGDDPVIEKTLPTRVAVSGFASVVAGHEHAFAVKLDGTLWAWGRGQLGDGSNAVSKVPKQVGEGYASIVPGYDHTVGLKRDGTLWTWGANYVGQLGDDSPRAGRNIQKQIGSGFSAISQHYALKADGSLWAWGSLQGGYTGTNDVTRIVSPQQVGTGFAAISEGGQHTIALKLDGTVWTWGSNSVGQLGDGTRLSSFTPQHIGSGFSAIAAGSSFSAALKPDGSLWVWGADRNYGHFTADGVVIDRLVPEQIGSGFVSIATALGYNVGAAIKADGSLWVWGDNRNGQFGDGFNELEWPQLAPKAIASAVTNMAGGRAHSAALKADGSLWAWGYNRSGEVGNGSTTVVSMPIEIGANYMAVAAGGRYSSLGVSESFTVGLKRDGSVWAWGGNSRGQLGDGSLVNSSAPKQVASGFAAISVGGAHTVAIKPDGTVWSWGANDMGQLGDKSTVDRLLPTATGVVFIGAGAPFKSVAAGGAHTLGLQPDGSLWSWGSNSAGQLGNGSTRAALYPILVGSDFTAIAAGSAHSLALKTDGSLWGWGQNSGTGQLGDGTLYDSLLPKQIMTDVAAIAAGGEHSLALKTDGTLWAWGRLYNVFGFCTDTCSNVWQYYKIPTRIGTGYTAIAAGANHGLALRADGSLWVWGAPGGAQPAFSQVPKQVDIGRVQRFEANADCLFAWAAKGWPTEFAPEDAPVQSSSQGRWRYFSGTQSGLAVVPESAKLLYVGPLSAGTLLDLGDTYDWFSKAQCQN